MNLPMRFLPLLLICLFLSSCNGQSSPTPADGEMIYERVDNATFKAKMADANTVILDVRTLAETNRGAITGAQFIDYRAPDFEDQIAALDRDKTYLVYCQGGGRSAKTARLMQSLGFGEIYELKNGYGGWE